MPIVRGSKVVSQVLSWVHTIAEGDNRIICVYTVHPSAQYPSITYAGNTFTLETHQQNRVKLFYLVDPPTGSNTIEVSGIIEGALIAAYSIDYTGVNQSNPWDATNKHTVSGPNSSLECTISVDNAMIIDGLRQWDATPHNPGSGQTKLMDNVKSSWYGFGSEKNGTLSVGINTMSWTTGATEGILHVLGVLAPALVALELFETLSLSDSLIFIPGKILLENMDIDDEIPAKTARKVVSEDLELVDAFTRTVEYKRTYSETLELIDEIRFGSEKILSEDLSLTDTYNRIVEYRRSYSENLNIADVFSRVVNYVRTFEEALKIEDIFESLLIIKLYLAEDLILADVWSYEELYIEPRKIILNLREIGISLN